MKNFLDLPRLLVFNGIYSKTIKLISFFNPRSFPAVDWKLGKKNCGIGFSWLPTRPLKPGSHLTCLMFNPFTDFSYGPIREKERNSNKSSQLIDTFQRSVD